MEQPLAHPNAPMIVYVASSEPEAYIIAGRLESEGVQSWVQRDPLGNAYGLTVGPLGEVKVLVRPEDYDRAVEILDEDVEETTDADALDLYDDDDYDDDDFADDNDDDE